MPAAAFDSLFRQSLDYRLALVRMLALQWSQATRYAFSLDWPIDFRIGGWLQLMHRYFNLESGAGPNIAASFVLEDVAQWLGTTRQAVSRQLKALEAQGVIRRTRRQLEVLQPGRLPQIVPSARVSGSA
jgi:CRP-like cAMP-binding protein